MERHARLRSHTPLQRFTPIRPRARHPKRIYTRDKAYIAWLHTQPCVVEGKRADSPCGMLITAHHVGHFGQARINDYRAVPLCACHHMIGCGPHAVHQLSRQHFEEFFGLKFDDEIRRLAALYEAETGKAVAA